MARYQHTAVRDFNAVTDEFSRVAGVMAGRFAELFTGTLTGFATPPTGVVRYEVNGEVCTMFVPQMSGTSNATTMTITGAPAGARPARQQEMPYRVQDNGTVQLGMVQIATTGVLTFFADVTGAAFTATGTKGVETQTITYVLS